MEFDRAKEILELNRQVYSEVEKIYKMDLYESDDMLDIQFIESALKADENVHLLNLPIKNDRVGAVACTIGLKHFILLNTNISRGERNYHFAHDYYHIKHEHSNEVKTLICEIRDKSGDLAVDYSDPHKNKTEKMASLYASMILLPEKYIRKSYDLVCKYHPNDLNARVCEIMNSKMVPFTLVVIRLRELELIDEDEFRELLLVNHTVLVNTFDKYGINKACIELADESNYQMLEERLVEVATKKPGEISDYSLNEIVKIISLTFDIDLGDDNE